VQKTNQIGVLARAILTRCSFLQLGVAALACLLPSIALADGHYSFDLSNSEAFLTAAALSLPSALVCAALEWSGTRRRIPLWVGVLAALAMIYSIASGPGYQAILEFDRDHFGGNLYNLGLIAVSVFVFNMLTVPPYGTLALVALVPNPRYRFVAVWGVSLLTVGLYMWLSSGKSVGGNNQSQGLIMIGTGAGVSLALWTLAHTLCQASLRRTESPAGGASH